ncbi:alpha/beta fold hydrolase [Hydrogenophaga sp. ZJX-1]|uniref:alpha/beta fold hydrolase n=1 Tax=Hydrogenophaga sp. ZJX-1 TaxID=3404778 RepID=UPI003B281933
MRILFSPVHEVPAAVPAITPPQRRRAGRFAEEPGTQAVRRVYSALCRFTPRLAAHLAYRQLATPPRAAAGRWPSSLHAPMRSHRLPCGVGELAVYEWGRGPAVLLVHGWGSNAMCMGRMVLPLLRAGFRVIAFDAPAHGQSSGRRTDMVAFAYAVTAVARHAGPLHAVVGHSFGAAMTLYAARDWGLATSRLVLISSFDHCNWFVDLFAQHVGLTPEVIERVREMQVQRQGGHFDWGRMSVVEMARQARLPALLVHDQTDEEVPFEHSLKIASAIDHAEFERTRGLGHHRVVRNAGVIRRVVDFVAH